MEGAQDVGAKEQELLAMEMADFAEEPVTCAVRVITWSLFAQLVLYKIAYWLKPK